MSVTKIYSNGLNMSTEVGRVVGELGRLEKDKPILIVTVGIHGNEPSSIFAAQRFLADITTSEVPINGHIKIIAGNLEALAQQQRYIDSDLNRVWAKQTLDSLQNGASHPTIHEHHEMLKIWTEIEPLLEGDQPKYFVDLHTTSSPTSPFIAMDNTAENRDFALSFPVPVISGLGTFIQEPLLSLMSAKGIPSMAFEAGPKEHIVSYKNHIAFLNLAAAAAGIIERADIENYEQYQEQLEAHARDPRRIFEIVHREALTPQSNFRMKPGYTNFQPIDEGENLAMLGEEEIKSTHRGRIFMPLYQAQGDDGFFIIR